MPSGVGVARQNKGLGDMAQGRGDGLTADLSALTKSSRTDSGSESHENVDVLGLGDIDQELVEAEPCAPCAPIVPVSRTGLSVHRCICNFAPRSVEITLELIADVGWTSRHERVCERLEREKTSLNEVSNASSVLEGCPRAVPEWKRENEREATSARRLRDPA